MKAEPRKKVGAAMEKLFFLNEFIKNWREVGAITPSSKFLVEKVLKPINWERAKVIVEFGPGSGCMTNAILKKMGSEAKLVLFETNIGFYKELQNVKDPRVTIYNESATKLLDHVDLESVDYIISGIPLRVIPGIDKKDLLTMSYDALKSGGKYIQFMYSAGARKELKSIFGEIEVDFTARNIPPAFVHSCTKK